jgi:hypothetical protein
VERRWRCVQQFIFGCKFSWPGCPDPCDKGLDLLDASICDLSLLHMCARCCMLTPSTLLLCGALACHRSWVLSASCPLVPEMPLFLCFPFLPAIFCWSGLLLPMQLCQLVTTCSLLTFLAVACYLSFCLPYPGCPGTYPFPSAPLGLLRASSS